MSSPIGVKKIKYTIAITIGAITLPKISPNFIHAVLNGANKFDLISPNIKKIKPTNSDQILISSPYKSGQNEISKKIIKKSTPKLLFELLFSIILFIPLKYSKIKLNFKSQFICNYF